MLSLTYFSTSTGPLGKDELVDLLARSRSNNEKVGLTGLLLYSDGSFVQTLEGPDHVVDEAFRRIAGDVRHRSVSVALREQVTERFFPDWSMGFREVSGAESDLVPGFSAYLESRNAPRTPGGSRAEVFHRAFRAFLP